MIEVFTTNIQSKVEANQLLKTLRAKFPKVKVDYDLSETKLSYPCGHSVLRAEGSKINSENIISIVKQSGFKCDVLEDKVCGEPVNKRVE